MALEYDNQENEVTMVAEPVATYGTCVSESRGICASHYWNFDSDLQRSIPVEVFRKECHKELRRMYGKL